MAFGNNMELMTETNGLLRGSCLCGSVTYAIRGPFSKFAHCHCTRCRKATGAAHASNIYLNPEQLTWISGEDVVARFDLPSAASFARWFCRNCGGPVPRVSRSGRTVVVPAGTLDDHPNKKPKARIFCGSEAAWACGADDTPRYAEYPEWW
jgi:hypothetical protein